jgi:hypothetical protein
MQNFSTLLLGYLRGNENVCVGGFRVFIKQGYTKKINNLPSMAVKENVCLVTTYTCVSRDPCG